MTATSRLRKIRLTNFKAFADLSMDIGRLTVLTGTNSSGKSSVLQSIALLEQSRDTDPPGLVLNGSWVELGTFDDLLFDRIESMSEGRTTGIEFWAARKGHLRVSTSATGDADYLPAALGPSLSLGWALPWQRLVYLRADRQGPSLLHIKSHEAVVRRHDIGVHGEYAVHYLLSHREADVPEQLRFDRAIPKTLEAQCEAWIDRISAGTRLHVRDLPDTGTVVLQFSDGPVTGFASGRPHRSTNVGFGLSYALPIVLACLSAKPGDLLLVENPEAHLHPGGQGVLADLCIRAVRAGAQVLLETHSDHILNHIRLAVAKVSVKPSEVKLYFFQRVAEDADPGVWQLKILGNGQVTEWPPGFFDEYGNVLIELAGYQ